MEDNIKEKINLITYAQMCNYSWHSHIINNKTIYDIRSKDFADQEKKVDNLKRNAEKLKMTLEDLVLDILEMPLYSIEYIKKFLIEVCGLESEINGIYNLKIIAADYVNSCITGYIDNDEDCGVILSFKDMSVCSLMTAINNLLDSIQYKISEDCTLQEDELKPIFLELLNAKRLYDVFDKHIPEMIETDTKHFWDQVAAAEEYKKSLEAK